MNPIFTMMKQQPPQQETLDSVLSDVRAGKTNPKEKALAMLASMSTDQRRKFTGALSLLTSLARKYGASEQDINEVLTTMNRGGA